MGMAISFSEKNEKGVKPFYFSSVFCVCKLFDNVHLDMSEHHPISA